MEDIVFNAKVNGGESLTSLKKEFKELNQQLAAVEQGTDEYYQTLKKLGKVKDDIGDLRDTIGALNPEGKIQAFTNVAGKLAGGFQAATGAAALFGAESEDLEKTLLRVQAATAFAEGIQSVTALGDAFEVLGTVLKTNPILLIATVIAGIVAAVKLYSDSLDDTIEKTRVLTQENERLISTYNQINTAIDENIKLSTAAGRDQIEILELQVKKYDELYKSLGAQRDQQIKLYQLGGATAATYYKKIEELEGKMQQAAVDGAAALLQIDKVKADRREAAYKKNKALLDKEAEDEKARQKDKQSREAQVQNDLIDKEESDFAAALERENAKDQTIAEQSATNLQSRLDAEYNYEKESRDKRMAEDLATYRETQDEKKRLAKEQLDAYNSASAASFESNRALSDLYFQIQLNNVKKGSAAELEIKKKQFQVNKAFSIASAVINGVLAVQAALTIAPPAGYVLAIASGILAVANVAKIAATKFDGGAAGGSTSLPSTNTSVPNIPSASDQPTTRFNADGTVQTGANGPTRAYVLESDITDSQRRINRIEKQSKF